MSTIADLVCHVAGQALGTVIHIGAGPSPHLGDDERLHIRRLVLVEGDPDTAGDLAARVRKRPGVDVLHEVVTAAGHEVSWNRFNLPTLNGPCAPDVLVSRFPRLRVLSSKRLGSIGMPALLARAEVSRQDDLPNVLILDVPGQCGALLQALASTPLQAIDWILLRELRQVDGDDDAVFNAAAQALAREHFALVPTDAALDADPLWTHAALHFDATAAQLGSVHQQLRKTTQERDAALVQLDLRAHDAAALQLQLDELRKTAAALKDSAQTSAQRQQVVADEVGAVRAQWNDATKQLDAAQALLREQQAQLAAAAQNEATRQAQEAAVAELQGRNQQVMALDAQLHAQLAQLAAALGHAQLDTAGTQQDNVVAKLEARLQQLADLQAQVLERQAQLVAATARIQQLEETAASQNETRRQLELRAQKSGTLEAQLQDLQGQLEAARKLHDWSTGQLEAQVQQVAALNGQLASSATDNEALKQERQQLLDQLATVGKERDEQAHWHAENARWAKGLQADNERLTAELQGRQQQVDQLSPQLQAANTAVESLRRDTADRDQRQHMMDREIVRAQAQLDLIKDVLIREKNF